MLLCKEPRSTQHVHSALYMLGRGPLKVAVIGCGSWGTKVASLAATNAHASYIFADEVLMYVRAAEAELVQTINHSHCNTKYLPGVKLPTNLVASSDLQRCAREADLVVMVTPHLFVEALCQEMRSSVKPTARACSLVKGLLSRSSSDLVRLSEVILTQLGVADCTVLAGANIASQVEQQEFAEGTLGYSNIESALLFQLLFHTPYYRVSAVPDVAGVEVCGALKNIVAIAAGFVDGLGYGVNTKAAIIRIGFAEIKAFAKRFFEGVLDATFFESCGFADLLATCYEGRNHRCAVTFAMRKGSSTMQQIQDELLGGQELEGPSTCAEVYTFIQAQNALENFPLFVQTHLILFNKADPDSIVSVFRTLEPVPLTNRIS